MIGESRRDQSEQERAGLVPVPHILMEGENDQNPEREKQVFGFHGGHCSMLRMASGCLANECQIDPCEQRIPSRLPDAGSQKLQRRHPLPALAFLDDFPKEMVETWNVGNEWAAEDDPF
jgi:hypothetical protein